MPVDTTIYHLLVLMQQNRISEVLYGKWKTVT